MKNDQISLKNSWVAFGRISLGPGVLFLLVTIISLIVTVFFTYSEITPLTLVVLVTVVALLSGLTGGMITKDWNGIHQEKEMTRRGHHAIRNLNLMLSHIFSIKKRVKVYLNRLGNDANHYELLKSNFEEIIEKCNNLFENAVNSIEHWQDLIPEANLKAQISVVHDLRTEFENKKNDLRDLRSLSDKMDRDVSEAERTRLRMSIDRMETAIERLEIDMRKEEAKLLIDKGFFTLKNGNLQFADFPDLDFESNLENVKPLKTNNNFLINQKF